VGSADGPRGRPAIFSGAAAPSKVISAITMLPQAATS